MRMLKLNRKNKLINKLVIIKKKRKKSQLLDDFFKI